MKTNEKNLVLSKALHEVWEWKDDVYNDIKEMSFEEKRLYLNNSMKEAANIIIGKIIHNPDSSYYIK